MTDPVYEKVSRMNDQAVARTLEKQITDPSNRYYGGIADDRTGIPSPSHGGTPAHMASMAAALVNTDSKYYHDPKLLTGLDLAADYMLKRQHADGTISLGSTNYHSPPDTGFVVTGMGQIYRLLNAHPWENVRPVAEKIKLFMERAIPALLTGGCHTPNHRWVMTAALGWLYDVFRLEPLRERADEWLAEGMDCTEDGEWTERSNGIYNTVSDIMLYHTATLLDRPEVLEPVRRNLRMMVYMVHPNGEVVTDYSGRQDFGTSADLSEYFLIYRLMAAFDRDPLFAAMSDFAAEGLSRLGPVNNHAMLGLLAFPFLHLRGLTRAPLPDRYVKIINENHPVAEHLRLMERVGHHGKIMHSSMHTSFGAPIVRYRDQKTSVTVMTRSPSFFSLRHGQARLLATQLFTSFTPGLVEMEEFARTHRGYRMSNLMSKGYNGPIPKERLPVTSKEKVSPWYLLPHQYRPITHLQKHKLEIEVIPGGSQWLLHVKSDDFPDVFTQIAFAISTDSEVAGEGLQRIGNDMYFWKGGPVRCMSGGDWIEISSGAHDHHLETIRNASLQQGVQFLLVNLLTPFDHTFRITFGSQNG